MLTRAMTNQIRARQQHFPACPLQHRQRRAHCFRAPARVTPTPPPGRGARLGPFTVLPWLTGKPVTRHFLNAAGRVANYYLTNVPPDYVPYWDFDAPDIPNAPRDSSSAAITLVGPGPAQPIGHEHAGQRHVLGRGAQHPRIAWFHQLPCPGNRQTAGSSCTAPASRRSFPLRKSMSRSFMAIITSSKP